MANLNVEIQKPDIQTVSLGIVGTNALICHKWSDRSKKGMLDNQMKKAKVGKTAKDPQLDYEESLYRHPDGGYGFPAIAFKLAAVRAAKMAGMNMTDARTLFYINEDLVKIKGKPSMREDMVKIAKGTADIRYRGEFKTWETDLTITYNASVCSLEQIVNLISLAGFSTGVGEWRPERNGQFGTFKIKSSESRRRN